MLLTANFDALRHWLSQILSAFHRAPDVAWYFHDHNKMRRKRPGGGWEYRDTTEEEAAEWHDRTIW